MNLIQCKKITVNIANKNVCKNLDLAIKPGQVWGILGRNGVGKTTLLHTLAGLRKTDSGQILLNTTNIKDISRKKIAQTLGLLLQQSEESFPSSVIDTVLTGRHPHIDNWSWESNKDLEIAKKALETVQMLDMANRSVDQLSGGEKQRVAIASLIAQAPQLYLLDEPNSHLDLKHQMQLLGYFSELANNTHTSTIMTLHDINLAQQYCTHLILLYGNGKVLSGAIDELLTEKTLSELYQYPLHKINTEFGALFISK